MKILITLIFVTFATDLNSIDSSEMVYNPDVCTELGENCQATAEENYENGTYTEAQYHMFVYHYCPNAELNCVLEQA